MLQCFRRHLRFSGCAIATVTALTELLGLFAYLSYYKHYLRRKTTSNGNQQSQTEGDDDVYVMNNQTGGSSFSLSRLLGFSWWDIALYDDEGEDRWEEVDNGAILGEI